MKIGLYGGTFSPPHLAHVRAARLFYEEVSLDKLYVMPAGIPPHKQSDKWGSAVHRLQMTKLAFSTFATVSDYEIKKEGKSYTVETLRYLREKHPSDELYMLVGEDMLYSLDTWRSPEEVMTSCTLVAIRRQDTKMSRLVECAENYKNRYGAKIVFIEETPFDISSTAVRSMIERNDDVSRFLSEEVYEYIKKNKLYI